MLISRRRHSNLVNVVGLYICHNLIKKSGLTAQWRRLLEPIRIKSFDDLISGMSQRGLDRKASRVDRSSSNLQRGSVSQAGRYSTAKLSSASVAGKFDKKGSKIGKGKKK